MALYSQLSYYGMLSRPKTKEREEEEEEEEEEEKQSRYRDIYRGIFFVS